jgi:hypothetical protein
LHKAELEKAKNGLALLHCTADKELLQVPCLEKDKSVLLHLTALFEVKLELKLTPVGGRNLKGLN